MKTNVALIGFMGVGKSAVGKILADDLGKKFVETDLRVSQKAGKTIGQIFQTEGEIVFREHEIAVIKEITVSQNQVIACGGGVPLNRINIDRIRQTGLAVWLTATAEVILKRTVADGAGRPLLPPNVNLGYIRSLLRFRQPFYRRAADITVDTSELDIESIVKHIIEKLRENADFA